MASGNDLKSAESTYGGFINMLKWGSVGVVIIVAVVITLIS